MIYSFVLALHGLFRWLVVGSMLASLATAGSGLLTGRAYTRIDTNLRAATSGILHTQLLIGVYLYIISPIIKYFWQDASANLTNLNLSFFALIHLALMLTAIVIMTVGASLAKRQSTDQQKFRTTVLYFGIAFLLILIAIPWPFSPLAARPWLRSY